MEGTSRPAWGCLDAGELRLAAAGHTGDPAIGEHLASCGSCRQEVRELRGALGRSTRTGGHRYRRPLLARPAFWLLLLVLGLGGLGLVMLKRPKAPPPPEVATASEPPPAAAPPRRPKPRRARPARGSGSPSDAAIVAVIRDNQTGVRMCYERALKRDPNLALRVDVRVNISAGGVVDRVSLDGLPPGGPLDNCIRNVIKTWKFPAAAAGYETAFPLRLQQSL
jgi:hypothetical protein